MGDGRDATHNVYDRNQGASRSIDEWRFVLEFESVLVHKVQLYDNK